MQEDESALVQTSWAHIVPTSDAAMTLFYNNLFEREAKLSALFCGKDMSVQRSHLAGALDAVVRQLREPQALTEPLRALGARHALYGVSERDFDLVGEVLLATLEQGLGELWTEPTKRAWTAAWGVMSREVLAGYRLQAAA